jgi:prepilin-type N-terminal cleavage/methylation domain-containing protein
MEMIEQRKRNRGQGGFTLIELLVVIAILAILAGVAVFAVGNLTGDAGQAACKTEYDTVQTAIAAAKASAAPADTWTAFIEGGNTKYWTVSGSPSVPTVKTPAPATGMTAGSTSRSNCDSITA